jgi:hypothetical protein
MPGVNGLKKYSASFLNRSVGVYGYQKNAIARLHIKHFQRGLGMLLADEMGLGKVRGPHNLTSDAHLPANLAL